jgi:hypothetical protein
MVRKLNSEYVSLLSISAGRNILHLLETEAMRKLVFKQLDGLLLSKLLQQKDYSSKVPSDLFNYDFETTT